METRTFGRAAAQQKSHSLSASVIGLGCWQLGADWGDVSEADALGVLEAAADAGVTFFDTADVYGDGRSERFVGELLRRRGEDHGLTVATKMGRRANPHVAEAFTLENFRVWNDRSRANLGVDRLDLVQLHCPPSAVYADDRVFDALDTLVDEGKIAAYGVSVETCEEALAAIARPGVSSIQIILNAFRLKPLGRVLPAAAAAGVGIIARVPLASGLLSGKYAETTTFADSDHRTFNRNGEAFDQGETFAGVPFEVGIQAAQEIAALNADSGIEGRTTAQFALRWIMDQPGVSTVIPGARNAEQARANAQAATFPPLTQADQATVRAIYDNAIAEHVAARW